ncbi:hypothetical protein B296_00039743, partial [Ensete ventricosum]
QSKGAPKDAQIDENPPGAQGPACFHRDYDHDMKECHDLKNQIEELIRKGYLGSYVKRPQEPSSCPHGLIEKQIDVIFGELVSNEDSLSGWNAYAQAIVEKRPKQKR